MKQSFVGFLMLVTLFGYGDGFAQKRMKQFIFFNVERDRIQEDSFLSNDQIAGAQLKYTWPELEPEIDVYRLDLIQEDLDFLTAHGKELFIQVQDVSFDSTIINVPPYILDDPIYHGGLAEMKEKDEQTGEVYFEGLVARRWDPEVAARFHRLLRKIGERFDGKLTGLNLPETSIGWGGDPPEGYTDEIYLAAVKENMRAMTDALPHSVTIQYANFMHGEWLPGDDKGYLKGLFAYAKEIHCGMGGPDIKVYKRAQMNHSYPLIRACDGIVPTAVAVQWGNLDLPNFKTGEPVTVEDVYLFARDYLKVDYIFWGTQEPHYTASILPFIAGLGD